MTAVTYKKSASREVRPFFGVASLEVALASAQISLYADGKFSDDSSFLVEERDIQRLNIVLRPNVSRAALQGSPIPRKKLLFVVMAVNPFLKRTKIVNREIVSKNLPEEVPIENDVLEEIGGPVGTSIEAVLCLAEGMRRKAGNPFLPGHWISRKAFSINAPKIAEDFDVEPTDDDGWKALGLPAKTLYFVDYFGSINETVSKDRAIAKVRIHSDVFNKLAGEASQKVAKPLMSFLAAEIPCQLLAASKSDWDGVDAPEKSSPLAAFLRRLNRVRPCTLQDLRDMVEEPGMGRLRAILHADQQTVRVVVEG